MLIRSFDEMEAALSTPSPGMRVLLGGGELYQKNRLSEDMIGAFSASSDFETMRVDCSNLDPGALARLFSEGSLFASSRLVCIDGPERLRSGGKKHLLGLIEDIGANSVLITTERARLSGGFYGKLSGMCTSYICYDPFERDLPRWVSRLASEAGIEITGGALGVVLAFASGSLVRLSSAVAMLGFYHGEGARLSTDDVREVLLGRGDHDIFDLSDAVFENRRAEALSAAYSLLGAGEDPVGLLAYLFRHWQKIERTEAILASGGGKSDVSRRVGTGSLLAGKLVRQAQARYSIPLLDAAEAFASADESIKTGGQPFTAISGLIFALTS